MHWPSIAHPSWFWFAISRDDVTAWRTLHIKAAGDPRPLLDFVVSQPVPTTFEMLSRSAGRQLS
jgi:hypothetical protein